MFVKRFKISLILWLFILGVAYVSADDYIETDNLSQVAVKTVLGIDNLIILPTTSTCVIRTIKYSLDVEGNIVTQKAGRKIKFISGSKTQDRMGFSNSFLRDASLLHGQRPSYRS